MKAPAKADLYFALVSILWLCNELLCLCSASYLEDLNPPLALHSSWREKPWCSHHVPPTQGHWASHLSVDPLKHQWDQVPTSTVLSGWLWGYEVNCVYRRSPVLILMYNTVQNKMEFTFKIKILCSYICVEYTAGEENARYIHNERHCTLVHEQKGLQYVTKIECDINPTDLFNAYFWKIRAFFLFHVWFNMTLRNTVFHIRSFVHRFPWTKQKKKFWYENISLDL